MTLDKYIHSIKILRNPDTTSEQKENDVLELNYGIDPKLLNGNLRQSFIFELNELLNITAIKDPIIEFYIGEDKYKVHTNILHEDVNMAADYYQIIDSYKDIDQLKPVLSLLCHMEDEPMEYSQARLNTNMKRLGELDHLTAFSIVQFFFLLQENYMKYSQIYTDLVKKVNLTQDLLMDNW